MSLQKLFVPLVLSFFLVGHSRLSVKAAENSPSGIIELLQTKQKYRNSAIVERPSRISVLGQEKLNKTFVPIGDSYTIGTGIDPIKAWPIVFLEILNKDNEHVRLLANPSRAGWNTQRAFQDEFPLWQSLHPDYAAVMLGANDVWQKIPVEDFRKDFSELLDHMLKHLVSPTHLIVLNIPDFSKTRYVRENSPDPLWQDKIKSYNQIIAQESSRRGLKVVDIFTLSGETVEDEGFIASDGLHPSELEHERWARALVEALQDTWSVGR